MNERTDRQELAKCAEVAARCACFNFRKAARSVTQLFDGVLQPSGLQATQLSVLVALRLAGSATMTRLARELVMDRTTLTRNLKPLEREGLVEIASGKDRRVRLVRLTPKGRWSLRQALPLWEKAQARVVARLGSRRWRTLLDEISAAVAATR
ncbi:MAG: MarR family winged helix-turn-helix transcriptional regulator [Alphaproteobacteria bacterium]